MAHPECFCQKISSFAYNHDVVNYSMKAHDISLHILERLPHEKRIDMLYTLIDMPKTVYISNCFSHR